MSSVSYGEHWDYDEDGDVGIWYIHDFKAYYESGEITDSEDHYCEVASEDRMDATIIVIENASELGRKMSETLDHISEEWTKAGNEADVDRVAYVTDTMMGMALKSKVDADLEKEAFETVDEALEWARS